MSDDQLLCEIFVLLQAQDIAAQLSLYFPLQLVKSGFERLAQSIFSLGVVGVISGQHLHQHPMP